MHSFYHPERRRNRRIKIDFPAICRVQVPTRAVDADAFEIATIDVSEGGISILSDEYLNWNGRIALKFISSDINVEADTHPAKHINFNGRVVHASFLKDQNQYRIGIAFTATTQANPENFFELVCTPHDHSRHCHENISNQSRENLVPCLMWLKHFFTTPWFKT